MPLLSKSVKKIGKDVEARVDRALAKGKVPIRTNTLLFLVIIVLLNLLISSYRNVLQIAHEMEEIKTDALTNPTTKKKKDSRLSGKGKHAIVYVTPFLDECKAGRLRHLAETAGRKRDIWVIVKHLALSWDDEKLQISKHYLNELKHYIHIREADRELIRPFDKSFGGAGTRFDSSKSTFLRLVVEHEYDFGWHVEDDVFVNGNWKTLFHADYGDADIVSELWENAPDELFTSKGDCWVSTPGLEVEERISCVEATSHQAAQWFALRASFPLAQSLLSSLEKNKASGYHEAVLPSFAKVHNMSMRRIGRPGNIAGTEEEEWSDPMSHTIGHHSEKSPLISDGLYYPVKCEAHDTNEKFKTLSQLLGKGYLPKSLPKGAKPKPQAPK